MPRRFLDGGARDALGEAITEIEGRSAAEVVVAVRARSGSYRAVDLGVGAAAALATLAVLLYSPWDVALAWFLVDPALVGAAAGVACAHLPLVRRWLTPARVRRARVRDAARTTFVTKRVHGTRGRTGLLVYVSLLEGAAEVVADTGLEAAVPAEPWARAVAEVDRAVASGGAAVADRVRELGDLLEPALPRADDDLNELGDEVCA